MGTSLSRDMLHVHTVCLQASAIGNLLSNELHHLAGQTAHDLGGNLIKPDCSGCLDQLASPHRSLVALAAQSGCGTPRAAQEWEGFTMRFCKIQHALCCTLVVLPNLKVGLACFGMRTAEASMQNASRLHASDA